MKPKYWTHTPTAIQEWLARAVNLDYESSREEAVATLLNNPNFYNRNCQTVQKYYETLSEEKLLGVTIDSITYIKSELDRLIDFRESLKNENPS